MMGERFRKTDSCGTAYTRIYELIEHPLSELYYQGKCTDKKHRFQPDIVKRYVRTIDIMEAVNTVEDLYRFHALHYEALVGDKKGLESVRVGDQYRIEFQSRKVEGETTLTICNIIELNHYQ